jgi:hypothetical protein
MIPESANVYQDEDNINVIIRQILRARSVMWTTHSWKSFHGCDTQTLE